MARFHVHTPTFGDYNQIRDLVMTRCPSALFDFDDEDQGSITGTFWVADEERDLAKESVEEFGIEAEPA